MPIHIICVPNLSHFQVIVLTKKWFEISKINNKGNSNEIIRYSVRYTAHLIIKAILTKL